MKESKIFEIPELFPSFNRQENIYTYGVGNSYPDIIEQLALQSVTATASLETAKSVFGKPLGKWAEMKVNRTDTLADVIRQLAEQIIIFRAFALHVNYNGAGEVTDMQVIPFRKVRLGKMDDDGNIVKAYVKDWDTDAKPYGVHLFNPDLVKEQMLSDQFNGQLLYWKADGNKWLYPLSRLHSVIYDMDAEAQASKFKRNSLRNGFFGKTVFITPPFDNGTLSEQERAMAISRREQFRDALRKFFGAENVDAVMHIEADSELDDLDKALIIKKIETDINDQLFAYTEKSARQNIMAAFKNIPELLIRNTDGSLFGVGGETIREAWRFYASQWDNERQALTGVLRKILSLWASDIDDLETFEIVANI